MKVACNSAQAIRDKGLQIVQVAEARVASIVAEVCQIAAVVVGMRSGRDNLALVAACFAAFLAEVVPGT